MNSQPPIESHEMHWTAHQKAEAAYRFRSFMVLVVLLVISALAFIGACSGALAHSWFTGARDPVTGFGCCDGRDCEEIPDTDVKAVEGGYIYLPRNEFIPRAHVQPSKSFGFACCRHLSTFISNGVTYHEGDTRCFFEPSGF